ncbi:MAG: gfo/Idh/MocA family oxidoreductase, partial [Bacteroidia bacterium]
AFANIYRNFALTIATKEAGDEPSAEMLDFPNASDGVRGMAFIENVVASSKSEQKWFNFNI